MVPTREKKKIQNSKLCLSESVTIELGLGQGIESIIWLV